MNKTSFAVINEKGEVTKTIELDLSTLPSSDPLAFAYGIHRGIMSRSERYGKHNAKHSELAQEYLWGFLFGRTTILVPEGTKIKKGEEQSYSLFHLNTFKHE